MCGLYGFSQTTEVTKKMSPILAVYMEARGGQSWGVTDGDFMYKDAHNILDTFEELNLEAPTYHTRAASVGDVCTENAHPFEWLAPAQGKRVIGVHNGHIHNHQSLKFKYDRKGVQVDSHHIFAHIAEGKSLGELHGWGTVVWYEMPIDKPEERKRYLSIFGHDALHVAKLESGEVVFASTPGPIRVATHLAGGKIKHFYQIDKKVKYELTPTALMHGEKLNWDEEPEPSANSAWVRHGSAMRSVAEQCFINNCREKPDTGHLVCKKCWDEIMTDFYGAEIPA